MYIADLHIHSKYSRATSRDCDAPHLDQWARNKGLRLIGTGDFTHSAWRAELSEMLVPAEEGLYSLREHFRLPAAADQGEASPRFVVSGEISTIYKKNGKTRKVHHLMLLPSLEAAQAFSHKLEAIGNLHSDGRPILGLDSHDLLEILLEACPQAIYIPAHIWTPHFSLFGAFSGFDTVEECYEDLTPYIHALETGLSSDPAMIRRVSALDRFTLVSNSDAHSPAKLGREANLLDTALTYPALSHAIQTGEGFAGTLEFFPEEGKYHLDGHRQCDVCLEPDETLRLHGQCPVCGRKLTIGVLHRINELADRRDDERLPSQQSFQSLIPLPELIASCTKTSVASKKTQEAYLGMLRKLGPELPILREIPMADIEKAAGYAIAEGISRMRRGQVYRRSGYDGEYGVISLFLPNELELMRGQLSLFGDMPSVPGKAAKRTVAQVSHTAAVPSQETVPISPSGPGLDALNPEQHLAVTAEQKEVAVIAGPGTGKTKTLVARIAYLIEQRGIRPSQITAVTFTRQAATEMRERLEATLGKQLLRGLTVGTFHSICLALLPPKPLLGDGQAFEWVRQQLASQQSDLSPREVLRRISAVKNGQVLMESGLEEGVYTAYQAWLAALGMRDLDDLLREALEQSAPRSRGFTHLLVDEFQDINAIQRQLIRHWHSQGETLFVIGDPDQSIYGFRGANARCFADLAHDFSALSVLQLQQNYRSAPEILRGALSVISHNEGEERRLQANRPEMGPIRFLHAPKAIDESIWIAKEISKLVGGVDMLSAKSSDQGRHGRLSFADIAVLCRTRHQLSQVESCLLHDDIPYIVYGREDYLTDKRVLGALGFFRSLLDPQDMASLSVCLQTLWRVPGPLCQRASVVMKGFLHSASIDLPLLEEALREFDVLAPWLEALSSFLPAMIKEKPRMLLQRFQDFCGGKSTAMEHLLRVSLFYENMTSLLACLDTGEEADIRRASGKAYSTDAVRLMTLHGSKGLEFPVVFLVCDHMARADQAMALEALAEERRLLFVGMTRAKDSLFLLSAEKSFRFLPELGEAVREEKLKAHRREGYGEQLRLF